MTLFFTVYLYSTALHFFSHPMAFKIRKKVFQMWRELGNAISKTQDSKVSVAVHLCEYWSKH